jgi:hypothetical protein
MPTGHQRVRQVYAAARVTTQNDLLGWLKEITLTGDVDAERGG